MKSTWKLMAALVASTTMIASAQTPLVDGEGLQVRNNPYDEIEMRDRQLPPSDAAVLSSGSAGKAYALTNDHALVLTYEIDGREEKRYFITESDHGYNWRLRETDELGGQILASTNAPYRRGSTDLWVMNSLGFQRARATPNSYLDPTNSRDLGAGEYVPPAFQDQVEVAIQKREMIQNQLEGPDNATYYFDPIRTDLAEITGIRQRQRDRGPNNERALRVDIYQRQGGYEQFRPYRTYEIHRDPDRPVQNVNNLDETRARAERRQNTEQGMADPYGKVRQANESDITSE